MPNRFSLVLSSLTIFAAIVSCAPHDKFASHLGSQSISSAMLMNASPIAADEDLPKVANVDLLGLTPEMVRFLDDHVHTHAGEDARLRMLLSAVMGEGRFSLEYDEKTRTAAETFRDRRGNCLSFTNMFVAMARYVGLDAHYQEVDIAPDWSLSGQSFLLSEHVNVVIDLRSGETAVIDFNMYDFELRDDRKVISDTRARAHYFNNLGVENMLNGSSVEAFVNFRQSLLEDKDFVPTWINLGILYRREGYADYAEAAYLQALSRDPYNLVTLSNLANLYEQQGEAEYAANYRKEVEKHRLENPYYQYFLANEAFTSGDYQGAVSYLENAIQSRPNEDRFLFLMSMTQMMLGDREKARYWMEKAEEAAAEGKDRRRYSHKLELLRAQKAHD